MKSWIIRNWYEALMGESVKLEMGDSRAKTSLLERLS